jgi:ABC-type branched-subunit amino acid transport system substrate-binding protein
MLGRWVGLMALISVAACGGEESKTPVPIGLSASLSGVDSEFGLLAADVVGAAVDAINARGGIDGHPIDLIIEDDGSEEDTAVTAVRALIDQDVVGIVGPFLSGQTAAVLDFARPAQVPLLSPSATAPSLADADDGDYLFRTTPNDNFQSSAIAYYFTQLAPEAVTSAVVVHETGDYGEGLSAAFAAEFDARGGEVAGAIGFAPDLESDDVDALWAEVVAANPSTVVVIALGQDANQLVTKWDATGDLPDLQWFFTDGIKAASFLDGLPAAAVGLRGTAPTNPQFGDAFQTFVDAYLEATGDDISEEGFMPQTWDAVYLLSAALYLQSSRDGEMGGARLRDALRDASRDGLILHSGQWVDLAGLIRAGGNPDYDGASGPVDFDERGETVGPYEVWEVTDDDGALTFAQVEYMDARDLTPAE